MRFGKHSLAEGKIKCKGPGNVTSVIEEVIAVVRWLYSSPKYPLESSKSYAYNIPKGRGRKMVS